MLTMMMMMMMMTVMVLMKMVMMVTTVRAMKFGDDGGRHGCGNACVDGDEGGHDHIVPS